MEIGSVRDGKLLRIGIIGRGAVGAPLAEHLKANKIPGAELVSILRRDPIGEYEVAELDSLIESRCDLVVEAAGHEALRRYGPSLLDSGIDLVVLSVGALADPELESEFRKQRRGRVMLSTGAIGGIDLLKAHQAARTLKSLRITSTTVPEVISSLVDEPPADESGKAMEITTVASGSAREVALRFPRNANVAATLALATLGLDDIRAEIRVDRFGSSKHHLIEAEIVDGSVTLSMASQLSRENPHTSSITPYAVIRLLEDLTSPFVAGV